MRSSAAAPANRRAAKSSGASAAHSRRMAPACASSAVAARSPAVADEGSDAAWDGAIAAAPGADRSSRLLALLLVLMGVSRIRAQIAPECGPAEGRRLSHPAAMLLVSAATERRP